MSSIRKTEDGHLELNLTNNEPEVRVTLNMTQAQADKIEASWRRRLRDIGSTLGEDSDVYAPDGSLGIAIVWLLTAGAE